uniref:Uncharacterized protein n=1 Tax=Arundo donax TaxID=35708 RepID=A0A0A9AK42_ARUDO
MRVQRAESAYLFFRSKVDQHCCSKTCYSFFM